MQGFGSAEHKAPFKQVQECALNHRKDPKIMYDMCFLIKRFEALWGPPLSPHWPQVFQIGYHLLRFRVCRVAC